MGHSAWQLRVENSEKGKEIPRKNLSLNVNWKNEEDYGLLPQPSSSTLPEDFLLSFKWVLCYRLVGSTKEIIQGRDSEVAFKSLAERLLWSSFFLGLLSERKKPLFFSLFVCLVLKQKLFIQVKLR